MPYVYYARCKECGWEGDPHSDTHDARKDGYAHKKEDCHQFTVDEDWWDHISAENVVNGKTP